MPLMPRRVMPLLVVLSLTLAAGLNTVTSASSTPVQAAVSAPRIHLDRDHTIVLQRHARMHASRSLARHRLHVWKVRQARRRVLAAQRAARARAAEVRASRAAKAQKAAQRAPAYSGGHDWDAVAQCESGGNWAESTGNGYYGGLQFSLSTWRAYGGAGLPSENSREAQIAVAEKVLAASGPGQWPVCGRYL